MAARFSLHRNGKERDCDFCGCTIPANGTAEYWKVSGLPRNDPIKTVCCLCHELLGMPDDGWLAPPDGRVMVTAKTPEKVST